MDQLIQQSYRAPEKSQPGSPDPILDDLLAALEHLMLTRGKIVTPSDRSRGRYAPPLVPTTWRKPARFSLNMARRLFSMPGCTPRAWGLRPGP
jgi:hypothetical protein